MMTLPGFSADAALYWSSDRYRSNSTRNFGNAMEGNRIYMQKPNSQNAPGGSCYGHTSGTTITGTYDFEDAVASILPMDSHFASIVMSTNATISGL